jgi:hypothetical protein
LLNQWCTPTLRLQVSVCSTFLITYVVQLIYVRNLLNAFLLLFPDNFLVL